MTPFATWKARLPTQIGTWFARDLVRAATSLVEAKRVTVRVVEDAKFEAAVEDTRFPKPLDVSIEWSGGTGPLALRSVCSCGGSGVCEHIVAALEALRAHDDVSIATSSSEDFDWLPAARGERSETRARCVWAVFSAAEGVLAASLILDSPRLRGAARDAASIVAMMESTPADDWDEFDRELFRDETILDTFTGRPSPRGLARALFRLARHPRLRFDEQPSLARHPSDLPAFTVDLQGLHLKARRRGGHFVPVLETTSGERLEPAGLAMLEGPPTWVASSRAVYLLDNSFDPRRVIDAARSTNGRPAADALAPGAIARVAPFLIDEDRDALGITDAAAPMPVLEMSWQRGALLARGSLRDRATGARSPIGPHGGIARIGDRYIRFTNDSFAPTRTRLLGAGFVPRGVDGFALHGADRSAEFVLGLLPQWDDVDIELDGGLNAFAEGKSTLGVSIAARRSEDAPGWFDLALDAEVDGFDAPLTRRELEALLASSQRYAEIRGRLVDVGHLREHGSLLSELSERPRTGFAALLAMQDELREGFTRVDLPDDVAALRERLRDFEGIGAVEPPELHDGALRAYQRRGLDFLCYLSSFGFGGILADDMGTGKTLTTIAYLLYRRLHEGRAPSLVIAPTSVTHTLENEIARFAPSLRTIRLSSGGDRAARYQETGDADVVITSYALARLDAERLASLHFRTLILDEAQNAKNPSSQIAKVVRSLQADHRLALTGTPVENSLRDLWSVFSIVEPGLLGGEATFRRRFEVPISLGDEKATLALHQRLEPFLLRRTKEDVAPELPERTEVLLECDLSPLQRRLYRGLAEAARNELFGRIDGEGLEGAAIHVLAALTRLRQLCAHPGLIFEEYRSDPEASAKFDAFLETVDEILSGGHRVLVFSAFASMLRLMRDELGRRDISYAYLDGSTKDRDRQEEVTRFMRDDGPPVFLCSLKAGGVGLTLTAADYVILYDPWWNPAIERQAIDRTHRIGQHNPVTAYRLVTLGTVEEKIRALAERKAGLAKSVIKADTAFAKSLTREDIEQLLADPG